MYYKYSDTLCILGVILLLRSTLEYTSPPFVLKLLLCSKDLSLFVYQKIYVYSTHLKTVPKIFVLILVISQRVAIFSNISKDLCGAFDFPFTCIFGYRFDLGEVMQSHKVMWDFYPLKPLKIYYTKNRGNLLKILLTAYLMCLIFDYWFKIRRN